jgi:fatty acid desaturase
MRATLNDELMHEAGFETDGLCELERRRELRRRVLRVAVQLAIIAFAATELLIELGGGDYLPPAVTALVALILVVMVAVNLVLFAKTARTRVREWFDNQI